MSVADFFAFTDVVQAVAAPDGDRIAAVVAARDGPEVRVVDPGGERRPSVRPPEDAAHAVLTWAPDGDALYVRAADGDGDGVEAASVVRVALGDDGGERERRTVVDRGAGQSVPWDLPPDEAWLYYLQESDSGWWLRRTAVDGETDEVVYDYPAIAHLGAAGLSPAGDRLALTVGDPDGPGNTSVLLAAPDGGDTREVAVGDPEARTVAEAWGPDGRRLLVNEGDSYLEQRVGVHDLATGETTWLSPGSDGRGETVLPDGRVLGLRRTGGRTRPVVYDAGDREPPGGRVLPVEGSVRIPPTLSRGAVADGRALCLRRTATRPAEAVLVDLGDDPTVETVVPAAFDDPDPAAFVAPERVSYPADDGTELPGLLYTPSGAGGRDPAPAVALLHGGNPGDAPSGLFRPAVQLLVDRGHVVFVPHTREDTYHGHDDYVAGLRWLCEHDAVDAARVGAYGLSHGGYDALMLATRTDLLAAAVSFNGPTDLAALAEAGEAVPNVARQLGPYDATADRWRERSPVTHADGLDVPVLLVYGTEDWVVPPEQGRRFREATGEDATVEHVETDVGHSLWDPTDRTRHWTRVLEFLEERL